MLATAATMTLAELSGANAFPSSSLARFDPRTFMTTVISMHTTHSMQCTQYAHIITHCTCDISQPHSLSAQQGRAVTLANALSPSRLSRKLLPRLLHLTPPNPSNRTSLMWTILATALEGSVALPMCAALSQHS